jgi:hypothetical protein
MDRNMLENKSLCCRMFSLVFEGRLCEGVGKMHAQSVSQFKIYQFSFYTVFFLDFYVNPEFNVYLVLIHK